MSAPVPPALAGSAINSLCEYDFGALNVDFTRESTTTQWTEGVWFDPPNPTADITAVDGNLQLVWHAGQAVDHTDVSRRLSFGHGYFEASLKWDNVTGAWPAFWLLPSDAPTGDSGEFDIMESIGTGAAYGNCHLWAPGGVEVSDSSATFTFPAGFDPSQFHTYAIHSTPGSITWYVDDVAYGTAAVPEPADSQHCFVILTINAGVNWVQTPAALATIAAKQIAMQVAWVRVWQ